MFVLCTCAYPVLGARKIIVIVAACMIDNFKSEIKATSQYLKKVLKLNIGMDRANPQNFSDQPEESLVKLWGSTNIVTTYKLI